MPVPNTDEAFTAKSIYLIRIVRNHVHVFHEFDLRNSTTQLRMKFANAKITLAFFFTQQVGGWTYYCHTDNFLIEWYERCPNGISSDKRSASSLWGSLPSRRLSSDDFKSLPNRRRYSLG